MYLDGFADTLLLEVKSQQNQFESFINRLLPDNILRQEFISDPTKSVIEKGLIRKISTVSDRLVKLILIKLIGYEKVLIFCGE
jgi:hypothetical protein